MNREALHHWIQASRPPFFIATFIPLAAGWILAGKLGAWRPWRMLLVLLGSFMVHLATNLADDYFDHLQGTDDGLSIGGSRVIQEGKIAPRTILKVVILLYALAFGIALCTIAVLGLWGLTPLVLLAWFGSFFYVAPPVRYGYRGLGELSVGINMGPVMVVGTYWVISGRVDWAPFLISIPIGLMVAVILYYQSLPDMESDLAVHKYTVAVRLGRRRAFYGLIVFWVMIYSSIIGLVLTEYLAWSALLSLLTIPLLVRLLNIMMGIGDWVELDRYGKYIRILYLLNGIVILIALSG
ncbi:MAG: 1,4-dihydroxy-2-naphthoate octaprenyltransferase [Deltaproteobacteria bacterium]|nr:1,4-dihydroxy-2-naphthoate octaprenyltransferase [Deltaproteobacteria bacterium]